MIRQLVSDAPILIVGLLVAVGLGLLFVRNARAALWTLVGTFVVTQAIVPPLELKVTQAGITFYALDVVAGLMFAIGVVRLLTRPSPSAVSLPLLTLSFLLVAHVAWGAVSFGLQDAVEPSRLWLYFLGPLVYCAQTRAVVSRASFLPLIVGAGALAVFGLAQIMRNGLYGANEYIEIGGVLVDARPVSAAGTLLIVQSLLIATAGRFVRSHAWLLLVVAFGASILVLQHRTVWAIALVAGTVAYLRWARVAIHMNERAAAFAAAVIILASPIVVSLVATSSAFGESIETATSSGGTLGWRTASWGALIKAHSSPEEVFTGVPIGTSLGRELEGGEATQSPHSLYVDSLLSFGILGPIALLWLWLVVIRGRRHVAAGLELPAVTVVLLIASQALFGVTSTLGPVQGILLGMLLQASWASSLADEASVADNPGLVPSRSW